MSLLARESGGRGRALGEFVLENRSELEKHFAIPERIFAVARARPDDELAPTLMEYLDAVRRRHREQVMERRSARADFSAMLLAQRAEVRTDGVYLPSGVLLGGLLEDDRRRFVAFRRDGQPPIAVKVSTLRALAKALDPFPVLAAWLGSDSLYVSWCAGRGRIRLRSQPTSHADELVTLYVDLPMAPRALVIPVRRPRRWTTAVIEVATNLASAGVR